MDEDRFEPLNLPDPDINRDGQLTIADLSEWALHLVFLPGDAALALLIGHAPAVARFFELGPEDYGGALSITVSIVAWLLALIVAGLVFNAVRNFWHNLRAWISGCNASAASRGAGSRAGSA